MSVQCRRKCILPGNRNLGYSWLVAGKQKDENLKGLRVFSRVLLPSQGTAELWWRCLPCDKKQVVEDRVCTFAFTCEMEGGAMTIGNNLCLRSLWSLTGERPINFTKHSRVFPVCSWLFHWWAQSTSTVLTQPDLPCSAGLKPTLIQKVHDLISTVLSLSLISHFSVAIILSDSALH